MLQAAAKLSVAMLTCLLITLYHTHDSSANFMSPIPDLPHIRIEPDGTVNPADAPLQHVDDTYILTRDLNTEYVIEVQKDNIVINGNGHAITGMAPSAIILDGRCNVTVRNVTIRKFNSGIRLRNAWNNLITKNTITGCDVGISLDYAVNNTILDNVLTENGAGILTYNDCDYNRIIRNQLTRNKYGGIWFESSQNGACEYNSVVQNIISDNSQEGIMCRSTVNSLFTGNNITNNGYGAPDTVEGYGIFLSAQNNTLYYNNLVGNRAHAITFGANNQWDNGTVGNYWSNYTGTDADGNGLGDTPFQAGKNTVDNYPLMKPVDITVITLLNVPIPESIDINWQPDNSALQPAASTSTAPPNSHAEPPEASTQTSNSTPVETPLNTTKAATATPSTTQPEKTVTENQPSQATPNTLTPQSNQSAAVTFSIILAFITCSAYVTRKTRRRNGGNNKQ